MIIWSGFGFVVAVLGFAALLFTEMISERITGNDRFYQEHGWVILIGMLVAAALTYGLHRLLLLERGRVMIDKQTGQEIVLRSIIPCSLFRSGGGRWFSRFLGWCLRLLALGNERERAIFLRESKHG